MSDIGRNDSGISWLSEDGRQYSYVKYTLTGVNTINATAHSTVVTQDLGYKAIRLIGSANFLSENMLLNNSPDNFTHGIIKNAWGYNELVYVQTNDNQLYEYVPSTGTWDLLGVYDVKKLETLDDKCILMLTNEGMLYHKGSLILRNGLNNTSATLVDAHDTMTRIFPTYEFRDFTFVKVQSATSNILGRLVVLME